MFGFGLSPEDKVILNVTEQMLAGFAGLGCNIKPIAKRFFAEAKAEALHDGRFDGRHAWRNIYRTDLGEIMVRNPLYFRPRKEAGLKEEDILEYWDRPNVLVIICAKIYEATKLISLDIAGNRGADITQFARDKRKRSPMYGDPRLWDQALPANEGFTAEDADLFLEFMARVGRWQQEIPQTELESLLAMYTSCNAMIRDLVRQGEI
jgi:hypothetical protein